MQAIAATLAKGLRTADIKSEGCKLVGTNEMGDAIIAEMEHSRRPKVPAEGSCGRKHAQPRQAQLSAQTSR